MREKGRGKARGALPHRVAFGIDSFPRRRKAPHLSFPALNSLSAALGEASIEPSTRRGYRYALRHWTTFTRTYSLPDLPDETNLALFVAFLSRRLISIPAVLSALAYHFRPLVPNWDEIRSSYRVLQNIKGAAKTSRHIVHRSPPLLPAHLDLFAHHALRPGASYDDSLALFIACVGMGGLLRLGEMVEPEKKEDRNPRKYVLRHSATLIPAVSFSFTLPYHKADHLYEGSFVSIIAAASPCSVNVVRLIEVFLRRRAALHGLTGFLFLRENGSLPSRKWFLARLQPIAPSVTGHGLRAGGATWLASRGVASELIRRWGRWTSSSWEIYIRSHPSVAAAIQLRTINVF